MSNSFNENEINHLIIIGEYDEATSLIHKLEEKFKDNKLVSLKLLLNKIHLLFLKGLWHEAKAQIGLAFTESNEQQNKKLIVESILIKIRTSIGLGEYDAILEEINSSERIATTIEDVDLRELLIGKINHIKGSFFEMKENFEEAKIHFHNAIRVFEKFNETILLIDSKVRLSNIERCIGNKKVTLKLLTEALEAAKKKNYLLGLVRAYSGLATLDWMDGNLNFGLEKMQKALELKKKLGNQISIAKSLINIGAYYDVSGELQKALEYYYNSLELFNELGNEHYIAVLNHNIGCVLGKLGELDEAIIHLNKGLKIFQEQSQIQLIAAALNMLGQTYFHKGNLTEAKINFQLCLQLRDSVKSSMSVTRTLYYIIQVCIEKVEIDQANKYQEELEVFRKENDSKIITQRANITKAMLKMTSTRARDRVKAEELFKEVIDGEMLDSELTIDSIIKLCELHLVELKQTGNQELLEDLSGLAKQLLDIAEKQKSHLLISEAYWLKSQIALINFDFNKAQDLLHKAQILAEEKGLMLLAIRISLEHDRLLEKLDEWKLLLQRNASIIERMEISQIEIFLMNVIRDKQYDTPTIINEKPVLLIIQKIDGLPIYSRNFLEDLNVVDESMLSGFLAAINQFLQEAFSGQGTLERIKHQEYTIIIQTLKSFLFCYVFKGQSFTATQKLIHIIDAIQKEELIWNFLQNQINTSQPLTNTEYQLLSKFVDGIFLEKQEINT